MASSEQPRPDGRQARWDRHNQERRQKILDAAIAVIEAGEPGAELHVQQIADRAGLSRTVVYRHFADRGDLDRAVQAEILDGLWAELLPSVTLDGTIPQIVERIVATYVGWAVAHPALHRIAEDGDDSHGALQQGLAHIAAQVCELITTAVEILDLEISDEERAAIDPLVFGLVGAVFGAVRRWMARPERVPAAPKLVELVTRSVWFILEGHGRALGVELDPEQPVEELLASAASGAEVTG
ncbi:TetR/AcrR family transcriptional regulator [Nocardioides sp. SYSU DS0663]|uniref:TetR/AcrR family transcriptional regulator n=1 Tax=Nocardioides sp. SYSU DS0663 TaxID=3416445 RepID=UPI003F4B4469